MTGLLALLAIAPSAGAVVTEVGSVSFGLQPRNLSTVVQGTVKRNSEGKLEANPAAASFANASGDPVLHGTKVFAVYWDPATRYHKEWQTLVNGYLQGVGADSGLASNIFASVGQYRDKSDQPAFYRDTFRGAYTDTHKYPTAGCTDPRALLVGALTCVTDAQLQEELKTFISQHGLPTGMEIVYVMLTPPGVTLCLDGAATHCSDFTRSKVEEEEGEFQSASYKNSFCSYHADINPSKSPIGDASTVLYAAIPWTAGGLGDDYIAPQSPAFECQDGGFNPVSEPIEEKEQPRERNAEEIKKFGEGDKEEKEAIEEEILLEEPHQQEPNQAAGRSESGFFETGLADLIINQIAVEQQNTITNPLLNAWQDSARNELSDECRNFFASGDLGGSFAANKNTDAGTLFNETIGGQKFYLNNTFDLAAQKEGVGAPCVGGVNLAARFTAPNPVNAGDIVGFDGMESRVQLSVGDGFAPDGKQRTTYATFTWDFGDGSPTVSGYAPGAPLCEAPWLSPCAASIFHSYQYGGIYQVTLTATDIAGNVTSVTHPVTVAGPPPPVPAEPGSSTTPGTGASVVPAPVPAPVAAAAIMSKSLKSVVKKGLVVRYSVNEQVAGRFEVLISRSVAKHLGITGPAATGLPAGSPPEIVASKALLITTKGGRSTVTIPFSKRTSGRLHHTHKLTVTLRLIVRNAASHSPASTTVVTAATLTH
jgi:hypothetical protein